MTIRYVGVGGNDSSDGLSWANRKLTLNGAENTPVVAGDTVYVGPGVYREQLTLDVSGSGGNLITYIADVTGEHTDGIGGVVRVTGSDNDQTATRSYCIDNSGGRDYRTMRGFAFDLSTSALLYYDNADNWIVEDCDFEGGTSALYTSGTNPSNFIIRRCVVRGGSASNLYFNNAVGNTAGLIENCLFLGYAGVAIIQSAGPGGFTVKDCTFYSAAYGMSVASVTTAILVYNNIFQNLYVGLSAGSTAMITENYNTLINCNTARSNVTAGGNSVTYPALYSPRIGLSGIKYPNTLFELGDYSTIRAIAGTSEASDDLFGMSRPATSSKKSWGAIQYADMSASTTQRSGSSGYSLKLADAARVQFHFPCTNASTTVSVKVYREANYAGTNPQLIIKQPGQSDNSVTDTGGSAGWNTLSVTLTPAALPPYVIVELVSNNTAISGSYAVYFEDVTVT